MQKGVTKRRVENVTLDNILFSMKRYVSVLGKLSKCKVSQFVTALRSLKCLSGSRETTVYEDKCVKMWSLLPPF